MINRRDFLKLSGAAAAGIFIPVRLRDFKKTYLYIPAASPAVFLDPTSIPKYRDPCVIPPAMPRVSEITLPDGSTADYYEIAIEQFSQNILPEEMKLPSTVWSFVKPGDPSTHNYPGFTIEATAGKPVRVKWINGLVDENGDYLPHLLPVDQTLHWANPPGPRDMESENPNPYNGPVPMVVHVHGAHTTDDSDGYPEAWYLPDAANIPPGYFREGTFYSTFKEKFEERWGVTWEPGSAIFQYPNDMRATTTWFHDHVLGITRVNVYAGPASFYLLRGGPDDLQAGELPGPAPARDDAAGLNYYEIPLAIQDRTFNTDGSLFYPDSRAFFEDLTPDQLQIPFIPNEACNGEMSDVHPIWNPEFFGSTIVVNGRTWPVLNVEARRYRLRLLNGCNSRFLILKLVKDDPLVRPGVPELSMWVIGNEGGFLPAPVEVEDLVIGPAERYDVIVDFSNVASGTEIFMINEGPDEPFGGGIPGTDFNFAAPGTTGQVMMFVVGEAQGEDNSTLPENLTLPAITSLGPAEKTRPLSLLEFDSSSVEVIHADDRIYLACNGSDAEYFGPAKALLGVVDGTAPGIPASWEDPVTETPSLHETEIWEFYNLTMDAHPIHIHQTHFEIVDRQPLLMDGEEVVLPPQATGASRGPERWEEGFKDTVIAFPGEVTRVKVRFDLPGRFVWHCHILEHEDNEMMRPLEVVSRVYMPLVGVQAGR